MEVFKKTIKKIINTFSKGVKRIMKLTIEQSKDIVEKVMETTEKRNKTGEVIIGLGVGLGVLGWCISDHSFHRLTPQNMNSIKLFVNKLGWILVCSSWILPQYIIEKEED